MALVFLLQTVPNAYLNLLPLVLVLGIFYFLLFLPMQRQKKQQREMLDTLAAGNIVQTSGGIIGTIVSRSDDDGTLILRVKPDNIKIQVARIAITGLLSGK